MRTCISQLVLGAVQLCLAAACSPAPDTEPPKPPPDASACVFELLLGQFGSDGFHPYHDGDTGYVTRGFQGFRFIDAAALLSGIELNAAVFRMRVRVEGHEPAQQDTSSGLIKGADGTLLAEHLMIFFNDLPMPELVGHKADIEIHVNTPACGAEFQVSLLLAEGECQAVPEDAGAIDGGDPSCIDAGL